MRKTFIDCHGTVSNNTIKHHACYEVLLIFFVFYFVILIVTVVILFNLFLRTRTNHNSQTQKNANNDFSLKQVRFVGLCWLQSSIRFTIHSFSRTF